MRKARLALADGTIFEGRALGADGEICGEVVFNTSMTGYEEILTDPSYVGQIVTMTYPEIGNYGITRDDGQAPRPLAAGVVVRNDCSEPSNWRAVEGFDAWLARHGLLGISGIDTRALTRRLRREGAMMGVVSTVADDPDDALVARAKAEPGMEGRDLATRASTPSAFDWTEPSPRVPGSLESVAEPVRRAVVVDFGVKRGILRSLVDAGFRVRVVPWDTPVKDILALDPQGVVLSNGPGDPAAVPGARPLVDGLVGRVPLLGICLGHQILALGLGAKTFKLRFGHRGGNHPVIDADTGSVSITAHNHGFAVDADSLAGKARITHRSLFDDTVEGFEVPGARALAVQYHPEACPGPDDARVVFRRFASLVDAGA